MSNYLNAALYPSNKEWSNQKVGIDELLGLLDYGIKTNLAKVNLALSKSQNKVQRIISEVKEAPTKIIDITINDMVKLIRSARPKYKAIQNNYRQNINLRKNPSYKSSFSTQTKLKNKAVSKPTQLNTSSQVKKKSIIKNQSTKKSNTLQNREKSSRAKIIKKKLNTEITMDNLAMATIIVSILVTALFIITFLSQQ